VLYEEECFESETGEKIDEDNEDKKEEGLRGTRTE
jgi:hypothetical protein